MGVWIVGATTHTRGEEALSLFCGGVPSGDTGTYGGDMFDLALRTGEHSLSSKSDDSLTPTKSSSKTGC